MNRWIARSSSSIGRWWVQRRPFHATAATFLEGKHVYPTEVKTNFDLPDPATADENEQSWVQPHELTKIVATIGPTSEQLDVLTQVVKHGMSVMRLNFSHATKEEVELRTTNLAKIQEQPPEGATEKQDVIATLLDTRGPEIRTGKLKNDFSGHETITLQAGLAVTLQTNGTFAEEGSTETDIFVNYANLHKCLSPGMKVLLDDGAVILTVQEVESEKDYHGTVTCTIDNTGELRSRAGVNLPMAETDLPAMSEKDRKDIKYGMEIDVDYVAASFVQNAEGVRDIRRYMKQCADELGWPVTKPLPLIISKIESASALKNFDDILEESDGIMVARGDLGVEIPLQQVTNAQKEMVAACNAVGKPVIVATQMLESMAKNPRPTRAEVSDVTNAVYDGADAVMLSGETAKGKYPALATKIMNEIILSSERYAASGALGSVVTPHVNCTFAVESTPEAAIAKAAVTATAKESAAAVICLTNATTLPALVSAYRPNVPILAFCPSSKVGRQLILYRGVYPIVGLQGVSASARPEAAVKEAKAMGFVDEGDSVIIVSVEEGGLGPNATMKIATVP